jgi:hypothetical protein
MLVPVVLGLAAETSEMAMGHEAHFAYMNAPSLSSFLPATAGVHSLGYLLVIGAVAIVVYDKLCGRFSGEPGSISICCGLRHRGWPAPWFR